jgi:hypothetical protein
LAVREIHVSDALREAPSVNVGRNLLPSFQGVAKRQRHLWNDARLPLSAGVYQNETKKLFVALPQ